jgi:hypothetical protein
MSYSSNRTSILEILEEKRISWPVGACSLFIEIKDYSGKCGRCGWSTEDHEYFHEESKDEVEQKWYDAVINCAYVCTSLDPNLDAHDCDCELPELVKQYEKTFKE